MQVLFAVIDDLFRFALQSLFGSIPLLKTHVSIYKPVTKIFALPEASMKAHAAKPAESILQSQGVFENGKQYYIGDTSSYIFTDPVVSFDTAYKKLMYGNTLELVKFGGRWAQVRMGAVQGWVLKDILRDRVADVFPKLTSGIFYDSVNIEVKKLRAIIDDMFFCGHAGLQLTSAEYVMFKLQQHKRAIPWPDVRPRTPGVWQNILRGKMGIHMSVTPKTQSVMEYIIDDVGYVAFVEAVFPDESIKLSGVGLVLEGHYTESVMTKTEWRELRPVFIEVA